MTTISSQAALLPPSGIREIVNRAIAAPPGTVARLEIGEPFGRTPQHVLDAAVAALAHRTGYLPSLGMTSLREALVERVQRVHGWAPAVEQVVVTQGAVQGIATAMAALLAPGDEVLVPDPAWPVYDSQALVLGAVPVHYPLRRDLGHLPDPDQVEALFTPRTRALVLNSPSNPTGSVMGAALVERLVETAAARGAVVISDEVYDELVLDGEHVSAAPFAPGSVVTAYSFSKTYSMTGWRVGDLVVPPWMSSAVERLQETHLSCVSQVGQAAALAALTGPQDAVAANRAEYRRRRDLALDLLAREGLTGHRPDGAFYLMVPLPQHVDSRAAALELLDHGVAVAPGTAFGEIDTAFLRLSLASDEETLRVGIARIAAWARPRGLCDAPSLLASTPTSTPTSPAAP